MKKFLKVLGGIFAVLLVTAIVFGVGYFFGNRSNGGKAEVVPASSSGIDLKLPGEVEKSIITVKWNTAESLRRTKSAIYGCQ